MRSLRAKLTASHTIPLLILMPALALYLLYTLEGLIDHNLLQQLSFQARLIQNRALQNSAVTANSRNAQNFLDGIDGLTDARVILLATDATILASTRKEDTNRIGTRYTDAAITRAFKGDMVEGFGPGFTTDVAFVVLPLQVDGVTTGALRLSYEVDDVRAQFSQLEWTILVGVALTALVGLAVGLGLANTITQPLRQLSASTRQIADGDYRARVSVHSQDEVGQLAQNFNQMVVRLEEAEKMRARQLAVITHELSRPLTGLRAALETLPDIPDAETEMRDSLLDGVTEEVTRLERMLGTLRGLARGALRPMRLSLAEISLERVVNASVANFKSVAGKAGIALSIEIPFHLPLIRADEDRLIQVMTNLLDNSFKFTPRGGRVSIAIGEEADALWVQVSDTGEGIAPEEMPYLFQQFYRGDESRPIEKRGMGLGLAICREIVTAHGGEIRVESDVGQGTRFTFSLPK